MCLRQSPAKKVESKVFFLFFSISLFDLFVLLKEKRSEAVRIVFLSDTHNQHRRMSQLPTDEMEVDICIHTGDFSNRGAPAVLEDFNEWMGNISATKRFLIPGNHDVTLQPDFYRENWWRFHDTMANDDPSALLSNMTVLVHQTAVSHGVRIYGFPYVMRYRGWAFEASEEQQTEMLRQVPGGVDVFACHNPLTSLKKRGGAHGSQGK
jgi:3',5'-cyclic AMP phosphodiesterase CpdA